MTVQPGGSSRVYRYEACLRRLWGGWTAHLLVAMTARARAAPSSIRERERLGAATRLLPVAGDAVCTVGEGAGGAAVYGAQPERSGGGGAGRLKPRLPLRSLPSQADGGLDCTVTMPSNEIGRASCRERV